MIACDKCGKANMADSRFCRDCGAVMTPVASNILHQENEKMTADAQRLFGKGRYDEASLVATAILENDPDNVNALALRGDCHERLGEYSLALECYQKILVIQPDSQLDRIRVARLEKMVDSDHIEIGQPPSRRRTALGAAIAAAVLLVSSGSALFIASQAPDGNFATTGDENGVIQKPFVLPATIPIPNGGQYRDSVFQPGPDDPDLDELESVDPNQGSITPVITDNLPGNFVRSTLPGFNPGLIDPSVRNGSNNGLPDSVPVNNDPTNLANSNDDIPDPDPDVVDTGDDEEDSGMIVDVRAREFIDPTAGSETVADVNAVKTLIRVAREHFIVSEYAKAAAAWERALKLGASPASTNQRLAQCYERLGSKAKAIAAYEKAITAFEKMDQQDNLVKASLDSCRQALKLIRSQ